MHKTFYTAEAKSSLFPTTSIPVSQLTHPQCESLTLVLGSQTFQNENIKQSTMMYKNSKPPNSPTEICEQARRLANILSLHHVRK